MERGFLLAGIFLIFFIGERIAPQMENEKRDKKHDGINIGMGTVNLLLGRVVAVMTVYTAASILEKEGIGFFNKFYTTGVKWIVLQLLILDFFNYLWHRILHTFKFLRRFHNIHHTDLFLNSTSALRFHIFEIIFGNLFKIIPVFIFGIKGDSLLIYEVVLNSNIYFHHSNIRIPRKLDLILSKVIVTPYLHRIHHSVKFKESNSNFSSFLIIWDKLFRSFTPQKELSTERYGIPGYSEREKQSFYYLIKQPFLRR